MKRKQTRGFLLNYFNQKRRSNSNTPNAEVHEEQLQNFALMQTWTRIQRRAIQIQNSAKPCSELSRIHPDPNQSWARPPSKLSQWAVKRASRDGTELGLEESRLSVDRKGWWVLAGLQLGSHWVLDELGKGSLTLDGSTANPSVFRELWNSLVLLADHFLSF